MAWCKENTTKVTVDAVDVEGMILLFVAAGRAMGILEVETVTAAAAFAVMEAVTDMVLILRSCVLGMLTNESDKHTTTLALLCHFGSHEGHIHVTFL